MLDWLDDNAAAQRIFRADTTALSTSIPLRQCWSAVKGNFACTKGRMRPVLKLTGPHSLLKQALILSYGRPLRIHRLLLNGSHLSSKIPDTSPLCPIRPCRLPNRPICSRTGSRNRGVSIEYALVFSTASNAHQKGHDNAVFGDSKGIPGRKLNDSDLGAS
jgi:hypothetical protein